MKHAKTALSVAVMLIAMAMPSISAAQYPDQRLDRFLQKHPNIQADLARNPDLIYNRQFRNQHPALQDWMHQHSNVWAKLPGASRWGDYDESNEWHESDWWHEHNPSWMYEHHPEWAENHPDWRGDGDFDDHDEWHERQWWNDHHPEWRGDGDFDDHDEWHERHWWNDHHPDWVEQHHPNWYKHEEHEAAKEERHSEKGYEHGGDRSAKGEEQGHHGDHGNKGDHDHH